MNNDLIIFRRAKRKGRNPSTGAKMRRAKRDGRNPSTAATLIERFESCILCAGFFFMKINLGVLPKLLISL